jgi:hypothetical protein
MSQDAKKGEVSMTDKIKGKPFGSTVLWPMEGSRVAHVSNLTVCLSY